MENFQMLSDKFTVPSLPPICVLRNELVNIFQQEGNKRVIFVSAPAGYGKTVSALLWLGNSEHIPIWIGLDTYDNSPAIFYKLLCTGILSIQPDNKAMEEILRSSSFTSSPVEHTIRLLAEFIPDGRKYAIILDDLHLITNEELLKSLFLVHKRLPLSFITLVLTRNIITDEHIEVIGREKIAIITAERLTFSSNEIQEYFQHSGQSISLEEARTMHDDSDGWPIGVQSLVISGQRELKGSKIQVLENYIKRQLWEQWDADLQDFLLKTSTVDEMSPDLCNQLLGREDSQKILEHLYASNVFIRKTSERTYQYHDLFLAFLHTTLEQASHIDTFKLYQQAAEWFFNQGDYFLATNYYIKIGSQEGITNCLTQLRKYGLHHNIEQLLTFTKKYILDKLPDEFISDNIELIGRCAVACFWNGDSKRFIHYTDILYDNIDKEIKINSKHTEEISTLMEVLSFFRALDFRIPLYHFSVEHVKNLPTKKLLAKQESQRPNVRSITHNLPLMHRSMRDHSELAVNMEERIPVLKATFVLVIGKEYYTLLECLQAGLYYEKNMLTTALAHGKLAFEKYEEDFSIGVKLCVHMILATVLSAMGKTVEALHETEEIEKLIEIEHAEYLYPNLLAITTKEKLWRGDQIIAKEWLDHYFITEKTRLEFYKIYQHFTTARAYLVLGETNLAKRYILKLKKMGTAYQRPLDIAEAGVLQAILEWSLGYKKEAQNILEEVLISMQEYKFVRVVANEGAAVLPILKKLTVELKKKKNKGKLDTHFLNEVTTAAQVQAKRFKGIAANIKREDTVELSKQQKHILTLMDKGYNSREIAEETGLTIHTIKSHRAAAYRKLDVHNATDAVTKAKELGLIE